MSVRWNLESADIAPLNRGYGRISSVGEDEGNDLLGRFDNFRSNERGSSTESSSLISSKAPLLLPSESYSITPAEKKAIKDYLDNSKEKVNLLKLMLIDLLLELVIKNVENANELAINDRTNAYRAYNAFNKTEIYNYDLNDFVHHSDRYDDYKEINDIVYKLKFINIIYLILQKNASPGDTLNEYKEPPFKYKDLISKELLDNEKRFENEAFKTAYTEFRKNYPLSWQKSLPAEEKVMGIKATTPKMQLESKKTQSSSEIILENLNKFIINYNKAITDDKYKLKQQDTMDKPLQYEKQITFLTKSFNEDKRWDKWKSNSTIELNMRNILVRISNAIVQYNKTLNKTLNKYLKTYLLEQIALANEFIKKKLDKNILLVEVNYKLTNFILTYNELIAIEKYKLQDINTTAEIKELRYTTYKDHISFKDEVIWIDWEKEINARTSNKDTKDTNEYIEKSMKQYLIYINDAIKALNKVIKRTINDDIIKAIMKLEEKIDDAIEFIGLAIYIPADAKRIAKAKSQFAIGEIVILQELTASTKLNNKNASVISYYKDEDRWGISYKDENGINKTTAVRPSKMRKISKLQEAKGGGKPHAKYKSTGITVSILYENKKYKRTVYTKDNRKTKYCKIDGEYILLSKMKNLSNKNPQRTFPKTRGGLGEDDQKYNLTTLLQLGQDISDSNLKTKIITYLDNSVGTVNFLKHSLVYKLLQYMNVAVDANKFNKDLSNVFTVYNLFKIQERDGLYVYDLKDFKHYTDDEDEKYKEIDNIVYKLKLINIVYLILKNNLSSSDKQNEYKENKFIYDISSLLKEEGKEPATDQENFKAKYKDWVKTKIPFENKTNKTPKVAPAAQAPAAREPAEEAPAKEEPAKEESKKKNTKDKLQDFIQVYNRFYKENYRLVDQKNNIDIEPLQYEKSLTTWEIGIRPTFNKDTRWDGEKWKSRPAPNKKDINMKSVLLDINNAIVALINAENKGQELQQNELDLNEAIDAGILLLGGTEKYNKELQSIKRLEQKNVKEANVKEAPDKQKFDLELYSAVMGGNPSAKYKSTGITVSILYEKKKYKRTVYTKDNRKTKYCKINNKYILLSKLNVIE